MNKIHHKRIVSFVLVFVLIFTAFPVISAFAADCSVVTTAEVRLRSTPEINDNNIITVLDYNEKLTLKEESVDSWAKVSRKDGTEGYCFVDYLSVPSGSSVAFVGHTLAEVNLRQGSSTDTDVLDVLSEGDEFFVLDNSLEYWVKVIYNETEGYIYRSYAELELKFGKNVEDIPSESTADTAPEQTSEPESVPTISVTVPTDSTDVTEVTEAVTDATEATESVENTKPTAIIITTGAADIKTPNWYSSSFSGAPSSKAPLRGDFVLSDSALNLESGSSHTLSVYTLNGSFANSATYLSSDTSVATVSKGGRIYAHSEGEARIEVTFRGATAYCDVSVFGGTEPEEPSAPEKPSTTPSESIPVVTEPSATEVNTTAPLSFELSASSAKIEIGNIFALSASAKDLSWSSNNTKVATVDNGFVTALSEGTAEIKAVAPDGRFGMCKITVIKASADISIEYSDIEISKGKTFFNGAASSAQIFWTSSNESVASVSNGFITATGEGEAVIYATSSKGTRTCFVKVTAAEPVRFTYAYPNSAAKGEDITLCAITDKDRTAVQFKLSVNGNIITVDATDKKTDGSTIVWTGKTTLDSSGTFDVTAYSKKGNKFSSCEESAFTVFVRESKDLVKETKENRRLSDEGMNMIAAFEGYVGNVYFDTLAGGIPTMGYGKVVYVGDSFYNDMTKTEAYAQLCSTVNNGGFSSNVNSYLQSLNANYNQQQFDALVSFAYNIGYYGLKSDSEIRALILDAAEKKQETNTDKNAAYVNADQVNLRKGAGTSFESLGWVNYPDKLTLVDTKLHNNSWYHVKTEDGRQGYIYKDYVTLGVPAKEGEIYLSLINKDEFTRVILEYHHAGGNCVYGLLYRRADELDLFYFGDYERDGNENHFGYSYSCYKDKNFKL